jgi:hypothetical protein
LRRARIRTRHANEQGKTTMLSLLCRLFFGASKELTPEEKYRALGPIDDAFIVSQLMVRVRNDRRRARIAAGMRAVKHYTGGFDEVLRLSCFVTESYPILEGIGELPRTSPNVGTVLAALAKTVLEHKDRIMAERERASAQLVAVPCE